MKLILIATNQNLDFSLISERGYGSMHQRQVKQTIIAYLYYRSASRKLKLNRRSSDARALIKLIY